MQAPILLTRRGAKVRKMAEVAPSRMLGKVKLRDPLPNRVEKARNINCLSMSMFQILIQDSRVVGSTVLSKIILCP